MRGSEKYRDFFHIKVTGKTICEMCSARDERVQDETKRKCVGFVE